MNTDNEVQVNQEPAEETPSLENVEIVSNGEKIPIEEHILFVVELILTF